MATIDSLKLKLAGLENTVQLKNAEIQNLRAQLAALDPVGQAAELDDLVLRVDVLKAAVQAF